MSVARTLKKRPHQCKFALSKMRDTIEIGTAKAKPGTKATGHIYCGDLSDGSPINVPVMVLNGREDGPRLWCNALEDGDEYAGCVGLIEATTELTPMVQRMRGALVAIPAVNITAFRGNPYGGGMRNSPCDLDQGLRFPRLYPGNPTGRFTEQAASIIHSYRTKYADYYIALHGCQQMYGIDHVLLRVSDDRSLEMAKAFGMKTILKDVRHGPPAVGRIPQIFGETYGGAGGIGNGFDGTATRNGILNVMKWLGIIEGKPKFPEKYQFVQHVAGSSEIHTKRGGFFKSLVKVEERVKEGQEIGVVSDFFAEVVEKVKSPIDGIVLGYWCAAPHIGSGQCMVFQIAVPIPE